MTWKLYGLPMCDVNEEEFAEYLLWHDALAASEMVRPVRVRKGGLAAALERAPPVPVECNA